MTSGLVLGTVLFGRQRAIPTAERKGLIALIWSSVLLTATVAGLHPTKGYWIYPFVWIVAVSVVGIDRFIAQRSPDRLDQTSHKRTLITRGAILGVVVLMLLPGAGLRTTWVYYSHWKDRSVYAPAFIADVLDEIQAGLFQRALDFREANTVDIDSWDDFVAFFTPKNKDKPEIHGGFARAHWNGSTDVEKRINDELSVSIRCIPLDANPEPGACILSGEPSPRRVIFAKSY